MKDHRITITVEGPPAAGKSAVAQVIVDTLRGLDFDSELKDCDRMPPRSSQALAATLEACSAKTAVTVITRHTSRLSFHEMVDVERHIEQAPGGLPAVIDCLQRAGYNVERSPLAALDSSINALVREANGGIVMLVVPANCMPFRAATSRADIVAEWRDGAFQVVKNRNGPTTRGE
jgi:hypothetical protein